MSLYTLEPPAWLRSPARPFLSDLEKSQLDAIFARILPADHARQIPSAVEAQASTFVSRLLGMDVSVYPEIPAWRTLYRQSLSTLETYAQTNFGRGLTALADAEMNQILTGLESGSLASTGTTDQKLLFTTLRRHCLQGCFADPRWGGNVNKIMWRALGYLQKPEDLYHG